MKVRNKEATTSSNQLVDQPDVVAIATNIEETSLQLSELAAKPSRRNVLTATAAGAMVAAATSGQAASSGYPTNPVIYIDDFARANFMIYNDWTPIVAAALASFDHSLDVGAISPAGVIIFGPSPGNPPLTGGNYYFRTAAIPTAAAPFAIEVNRTVTLKGCGGGGPGSMPGRTNLFIAPGLGGIRFNNAGYPLGSGGSQSGLRAATGSRVEDLCLQGNNETTLNSAYRNAHGIEANTTVSIRDVTVHAFSGHGIYLHGNPGDTPPAGCDFASVVNCWVVYNLGDGCHIDGHDANGCLIFQTAFTQNKGYGLYDNSLTGAVLIGGQFEAQATDIWVNNPSATTTCLGVYKESHGPGPVSSGGELVTTCGNAVVVGNVLAADLINNPSGVCTSDSIAVPTVLGGGGQMSRVSVTSPDGTGNVLLGCATRGAANILTLYDNREHNGAWPFSFKSHATGGVYVDYGASGYPLFGFTNSRCTKANGFPVDAALIPDFACGGVDIGCHLIGGVNHKIFVGVAGTIPTSTAYPVGSVIHNASATYVGDPTLWKLVNRNGTLKWVVGGTLNS
jgi:hypothetical protein